MKLKSIDDKASNQGNTWQFTFQERPIILIYDEKADRMRMFTPIGLETALDAGLMRLARLRRYYKIWMTPALKHC